jgi:hypothetical protein
MMLSLLRRSQGSSWLLELGPQAHIRAFVLFLRLYRFYSYGYAGVLKVVWYVVTGVSALGLLTSLMVRNESMDRGSKSKRSFSNDEALSERAVAISSSL